MKRQRIDLERQGKIGEGAWDDPEDAQAGAAEITGTPGGEHGHRLIAVESGVDQGIHQAGKRGGFYKSILSEACIFADEERAHPADVAVLPGESKGDVFFAGVFEETEFLSAVVFSGISK